MKRGLCAVAMLVATSMALSLGVAGASAVGDVVVTSSSTADAPTIQMNSDDLDAIAAANAAAGNGKGVSAQPQTQQLPDTVAESIPEDATIVAPELAVTTSGEVKHVQTGETVTDPAIVGTVETPPDPLTKTDGKSYIPVKIEDAKAEGKARTVPDADAADSASAESSSASTEANAAAQSSATAAPIVSAATFVEGQSTVRSIAAGNEQGAYWGTYNGTPAFFQKNGTPFVQNAKWVIDVSKWNGTIDWDKAKAAGVQGAIIRIGFGSGNPIDAQAQRNIAECKRLGIPFGIYLYSYAYDAAFAAGEGDSTVNLMREAGVNPGDLSYPVYYDLEQWSWAGHTPPTDPAVYEQIARAWNEKLWAAGYRNTAFYSYTQYLRGPLNNPYIHGGVNWVAQYSGYITYTAWPAGQRGWQYTSTGYIDGVGSNVDLNAFGDVPGTMFEVKGAMGEEWQRIGGSNSKIGSPVANEVCNWDPARTNCYQNFQYGAISWTPSTGAHYTVGQLRTEWANRGFENGVMGFPVADEVDLGNGWWRQEFQAGYIFAKGSTSYVMLFQLRESYDQHKGYAWLGAPVANEENMGNGWWRQRCEHGDVWTRGTTVKTVIQLELRDSYNEHGGAGWLGAPVSDEEDMGNGWWRQRCEHGDVWTRWGAKRVVMLALRDNYYKRGGFAKLGGPTSDERFTGTVWQQDCEKGTLEVK